MVLGFPRPILCLALYYRSTADCSSIFSEPFSKKETVLSSFPLILVQCLDNAFLYLSFAQSCKLKTCRHRPFRNSTGNWGEFRIVVFDKERFHNAVEIDIFERYFIDTNLPPPPPRKILQGLWPRFNAYTHVQKENSSIL